MKVLYQWAKKNPDVWEEIDSNDWINLPKRPLPKTGELGGSDNKNGWIRNVSVQGIGSQGFDHISIEPITIGGEEGVKYTTWNDDPDDTDSVREAFVWTILPLAPDPELGMAINTRQSCVRYTEGERWDKFSVKPPKKTTVRPFAEFVAPSEESTRHGIWLAQEKLAEHIDKARSTELGWANWVEHLPESETEIETETRRNGVKEVYKNPRRVLKEQRKQGRYRQAEHTITYYQRDTTRTASYYATSDFKDALELTTAASGTRNVTVNNLTRRFMMWTGPAGSPNDGDWPTGNYRFQVNVTTVDAGVVFGFNDTSATGGFDRVNSALTSSEESVNDDGDQSGTGLALFTATSWNPTSGATGDVLGSSFIINGASHGDAITITVNTSDSFADGPWSAGGTEYTKDLTEVVVLVDTIVKQSQKNLSEVVVLVDTIKKQAQKVLTEVVTLVDTIAKQAQKTLAEAITLTDSIASVLIFTRTYTETVTLVDTVVKQTQKTFAEAIALVDVVSTQATLFKVLTDTVTLVDTLTNQISRTFTETIALVDNLVKQGQKNFAEVITLVDSLATVGTLFRSITETINLVDNTARQTARTLNETIVLTDIIASVGTFFKVFLETITLTDILSKQTQKSFAEAITVADNIIRQTQKSLTEVVTIVDTVVRQGQEVLKETILLKQIRLRKY